MINLKLLSSLNINPSNCEIQNKYVFLKGEEIFSLIKENISLRKLILKNSKKVNFINYFFNRFKIKPLKKTYDIKDQFHIKFNLINHSEPETKSKNI